MRIEKLGNVFKITSGGTPNRGKNEFYDGGTIPWVKTGDLKVKDLFDANEYITSEGLENSSAKIFPKNTVLIAMYGATIGACSILRIEAATNQACAALLPNKDVDTNYLYYYLMAIKPKLIDKGVGGGQPNISATILKDIDFPLPDIKTQQEISHVLEQADKARQQRKAANALTDEFLQSSFLSLFGDPVKNEKGWEVKRIGDMGVVKTGNTPSRAKKEFYGDFIEWIKTDNIKTNSIVPSKAEEYLSEDGLQVGRFVEKGSVLVTCIAGSPNTIGNAVLTDRKVAINQQINSLTPSSAYDPLFVYGLFRQCKKMIQENTTKGMKRIITKSVFENIKFIKPPLTLQQQFAAIVAEAETLRKKQQENEQELEQLFQALLQKYFG